jgi:hypothetical protein
MVEAYPEPILIDDPKDPFKFNYIVYHSVFEQLKKSITSVNPRIVVDLVEEDWIKGVAAQA